MTVCIIPARGGSKRIPRKNVRPFHGKPLLAYSIDCARRAEIFEQVIVSTDDQEIADVARQYGAEVPFMRPQELADDHANTFDLMAHAAHWVGRCERVYLYAYASISETKTGVASYIDLHDTRCPHSGQDRLTPHEFYCNKLRGHARAA